MVCRSPGDQCARTRTDLLRCSLSKRCQYGLKAAARLAWRTRFSCFALAETKPGSEATIVDDHLVRVHTVDGADHELDAATFVAAVAARLPADASIDDDLRAALSTMP